MCSRFCCSTSTSTCHFEGMAAQHTHPTKRQVEVSDQCAVFPFRVCLSPASSVRLIVVARSLWVVVVPCAYLLDDSFQFHPVQLVPVQLSVASTEEERGGGVPRMRVGGRSRGDREREGDRHG